MCERQTISMGTVAFVTAPVGVAWVFTAFTTTLAVAGAAVAVICLTVIAAVARHVTRFRFSEPVGGRIPLPPPRRALPAPVVVTYEWASEDEQLRIRG